MLEKTNQTAITPLQTDRQRKANGVVNLGLGVNFVLACAKLAAGILGHSQALVADGVNSTSDVIYYIVVKIFVSLSGRPPDPEHPYGHHQFESIAAVVVGAFVVTTGLAIFWDSINVAFDVITHKTEFKPISIFALWVACATVVIKIGLMIQANRVSKSTKNLAIGALAQDHRNDIFSSAGAMVGIILGLMGIPWVDPIAGALVAVVVAKTGFDILRESSDELMDAVPSKLISSDIKRIASDVNGVMHVGEILAHRFGPYLVANVTIGVKGDIPVAQGNRIADEVEKKLTESVDMLRTVHVHYHPIEIETPDENFKK